MGFLRAGASDGVGSAGAGAGASICTGAIIAVGSTVV